MPELPEVETVCNGLSRVLPGRTIRKIDLHRSGLRTPFPPALQKTAGQKIASIGRRAKYILIHLAGGETLILHLGMSGRLTIHDKRESYSQAKHDHLVMTLDNGTRIVLNDPRRFGIADVAKTKELPQHRLFRHLGPEPLEKKFSAAYLAQKLKSRKTAVKLAIMDQRLVVGVGNIYAVEALFLAKINPARAAGALTSAEIRRLAAVIRTVLKRAIKAGGSSLRDYVQTDGELGYFQHQFAVYGKTGEKCRGCTCNIAKTGGIRRMAQGGRSTFYCPVKQE